MLLNKPVGSGRLWTSPRVDSKPTTLQEQQLPFPGICALPQVQSALVPQQGQELFHAVPHKEITLRLSDCIAPVDSQRAVYHIIMNEDISQYQM